MVPAQRILDKVVPPGANRLELVAEVAVVLKPRVTLASHTVTETVVAPLVAGEMTFNMHGFGVSYVTVLTSWLSALVLVLVLPIVCTTAITAAALTYD